RPRALDRTLPLPDLVRLPAPAQPADARRAGRAEDRRRHAYGTGARSHPPDARAPVRLGALARRDARHRHGRSANRGANGVIQRDVNARPILRPRQDGNKEQSDVSNYDALRDYLKRQTAAEFVLSFEQIEELIGQALPRAAQRASWWETRRSPQEKMPQREAC